MKRLHHDSRTAATGPTFGRMLLCGTLAVLAAASLQPIRAQESALRFEGVYKQHVELPDESRFDLVTGLTIEARVNIATFDNKSQAIVTKGEAWGLVRHEETSTISFHTHNGVEAHELVGAMTLGTNEWVHIAAVFDGSRKILYIDGVERASVAYAGPLVDNEFPVLIGYNAEEADREFHGDIETVRIWTTARTQAEIQEHLLRRFRGSEPGLVGIWRFDEGSGATAEDSSANEFDGVIHHDVKNGVAPVRVAVSTNDLVYAPPYEGEHALRFNLIGVDEYVDLPETSAPEYVELENEEVFDYTDEMTVETWIYRHTLTKYGPPQGLVSKGSNTWALSFAPDGHILFTTRGLVDAATNAAETLTSMTALDPRRWYHVAATWDGARKAILIDGVEDAWTNSLMGVIATDDDPVRFGAPSDTNQAYFVGLLDEVRLWKVALAPSRVADNASRMLTGDEPRLSGEWTFNEGSGVVVTNTKIPFIAGTILGNGNTANMDDHNRVEGVEREGPSDPQNALRFDGIDDYIEIGHSNVLNMGSFTIEVRLRPTGTGYRTIFMKGDLGYSLAIDTNNHLRFWIDGNRDNALECDTPLVNGEWVNIAITVNTNNSSTIFYIDGKPACTFSSAIVNNNSGPLIVGRQGSTADSGYFEGEIDEIRIWEGIRTDPEIAMFANVRLPAGTGGIIANWEFDEGNGTFLGERFGRLPDGVLHNFDMYSWVFGPLLDDMPFDPGTSLNPNPNAFGLWVGSVVLTGVTEVQKATPATLGDITPTRDRAAMRLILHVDADGKVRLLKDVTVMKTAEGEEGDVEEGELDTNAVTRTVLVTDETLIPSLEGVINRGGKMVGHRIGTVSYDFEGTELLLNGGLGQGFGCLGRFELPRAHPTNPFRHRYHPDHRNVDPRDDPGHPDYNPDKPEYGVLVTRDIFMQFPMPGVGDDEPAAGYGVERLDGIYHETIQGLHKIPIKIEGSVELTRISFVSTLND